MLQLFKSKVALLPFLCILALMIFLRINVLPNNIFSNLWNTDLAPFSDFIYYLIGASGFNNIWFHLVTTLILVFFQSNIIISIASKYKTLEFSGFLVAWLYVLTMHMFPAFVFLSPQLISLTFILLAFRSLLKVEEKKDKIKAIFNSGLFIGIASSFWTPSLIFLLLALFILLKSKQLELRSLLVLIISYVIPYLYSGTYFLLTDQKLQITQALVFNQLKFDLYKQNQLLSLGVIVLLLLYSLTYVFQFLSKQLLQVKEFFNYVFFYTFCVFLLFFIQNENNVNGFMFLVFPSSLFLTVLFNRIKINILSESLHLILLLSIIVNFLYFIK